MIARLEVLMLREIFPYGRFSPAATEPQIAAVEATLGLRLPENLRQLYLECDGFREERGNAKYLLSLTNEDHIGSLVSVTRFWWEEWSREHQRLDLRPFIFFGSSSGDESWGVNWQRPFEIVAYHHHMEYQYEVVGSDIIEVYQSDYARYDDLDQNG